MTIGTDSTHERYTCIPCRLSIKGHDRLSWSDAEVVIYEPEIRPLIDTVNAIYVTATSVDLSSPGAKVEDILTFFGIGLADLDLYEKKIELEYMLRNTLDSKSVVIDLADIICDDCELEPYLSDATLQDVPIQIPTQFIQAVKESGHIHVGALYIHGGAAGSGKQKLYKNMIIFYAERDEVHINLDEKKLLKILLEKDVQIRDAMVGKYIDDALRTTLDKGEIAPESAAWVLQSPDSVIDAVKEFSVIAKDDTLKEIFATAVRESDIYREKCEKYCKTA